MGALCNNNFFKNKKQIIVTKYSGEEMGLVCVCELRHRVPVDIKLRTNESKGFHPIPPPLSDTDSLFISHRESTQPLLFLSNKHTFSVPLFFVFKYNRLSSSQCFITDNLETHMKVYALMTSACLILIKKQWEPSRYVQKSK